jgi:immune inhibitor A
MLMPPYPGLIERLKREGKPLPPFITDPDFFRARDINQGPRRLAGVRPRKGIRLLPPFGPERRWEERPGQPMLRLEKPSRLVPGPQLQPTGNFNTLALLVHFTDNLSSTVPSFFDQLIFGSSGSSVRVYYQEVSYGTLTLVTVDLPSSRGWYTAPQTYAYYVNGQYGFGTYPRNAQRLTEDVVYLADPYVDFSQYDNDNDGYVDALFVIHAGSGAEYTGNPNDIWSHQWSTLHPPHVDGVYVTTYSMEPEYWSSPGDMTIGVYCHELGHVFGLPDLYDYDYDSEGVGRWSLMAVGSWNGPMGSSPAHPDAWSRAQLAFVTPVTITSNTQGVVVNSVELTSTNSVYYVWKNGSANNEYFLLENRQQTGYDAYLPSNGLLIWHVDENMWNNDNQCTDHQNCNCVLHYKVALEQADGKLDLEYNNNSGDDGDPYPGTTNNRAFNLDSTPNSGSYADCTSSVEVKNISNSGITMTADINVSVTYGVMLIPRARKRSGWAGTVVTYTEQVLNYGANADGYTLSVSGNAWPTTIWDATFSTQISNTGTISPCGSSITIGIRVEIPGNAAFGDSDTALLSATSVTTPTVSEVALLTTHTPPWEIEAPMPTPRHSLALAVTGGKVYAIGGMDAWRNFTDTLEIYDPKASSWSVGTSRPISAALVAAAAVGSDIYVPGGLVQDPTWWATYTDIVHVYHTITDTWDTVASLPVASCGQMVAALSGKVYVIGGSSATGWLSTTLEYNPTTDTWTQRKPIPSGGRAYGAAAVLNGKIYVVGGRPNPNLVEVYDPSTDSWTKAAPLNIGREYLGVAALKGYVFAIGGYSYLDSVERYDPATDSWIEVAPLNVARHGLGAAVTGGKIYAVGGARGRWIAEDENESYGPGEWWIYLPLVMKNYAF